MRHKTALLASILFCFSMILSAISPAIAQESLKIGVVLATTGAYAGMGNEDKLGAVLGAKRINEKGGVNGQKIELVFEDDEGDAGKGSTAIRKLISVEKVAAVFGSTTNLVSHAISLIAEDLKVPLIAPVPSAKVSQGKRFVFQNVVKEEDSVEFIVQYLLRNKWKKAGLLYDATEYGMDLFSLLEKSLTRRGIAFAAEKFSPRASDVTPQWLSLKNKGIEGVVLIGGPPTAPAIAMKNRKQMGISLPVIGTSSLNNQKFIGLTGDAAEGMALVSYFHYGKWTQGESDFINAMKKESLDVFPTLQHALGWDAIHLFAMAMKTAGKDPVKIRDELEKIKGYELAAGEYNFTPGNHQPLSLQALTTVKVQNGKFVLLGE